MNRHTAFGRARAIALRSGTAEDSAVRASDLIRVQRAPTAPWSVFVDVEDDSRSDQRRRTSRDSLVRRRPTEWSVVDDKSEGNKENVGYEVRRPKRARPSLPDDDEDDDDDAVRSPVRRTTETTTSVSTPSPKNKGKRKLQTPTPPKTKIPKKPKITVSKSEPEVRVEPSVAPPATTAERARRPLEDITHLFIDPTAHYFQPWRRATRVATVRPSAMRIL